MPNVLIVAEQQPDGQLRKATLNAIAAGKALAEKTGGELHVALFGHDPSKVGEELKGYGAKVVHVAPPPRSGLPRRGLRPHARRARAEPQGGLRGRRRHRHGQGPAAARGRPPGRRHGHRRDGLRRQRRGHHLHPPDVGRQRDRRRGAHHPGEGLHRAHHRVPRGRPGAGAAAEVEAKAFEPKLEAAKTRFVDFKEVQERAAPS